MVVAYSEASITLTFQIIFFFFTVDHLLIICVIDINFKH